MLTGTLGGISRCCCCRLGRRNQHSELLLTYIKTFLKVETRQSKDAFTLFYATLCTQCCSHICLQALRQNGGWNNISTKGRCECRNINHTLFSSDFTKFHDILEIYIWTRSLTCKLKHFGEISQWIINWSFIRQFNVCFFNPLLKALTFINQDWILRFETIKMWIILSCNILYLQWSLCFSSAECHLSFRGNETVTVTFLQ